MWVFVWTRSATATVRSTTCSNPSRYSEWNRRSEDQETHICSGERRLNLLCWRWLSRGPQWQPSARRWPTRPNGAIAPPSATQLTRGVDVNATQIDGHTALHWAAHYDDAETVALLVKAGANVNAANHYGVPPLALACTNGNAAVVRMLLEAGADANVTMKGGETALMMAARSGSVDAVKALLVRGAKHDLRERHGQTALMWAAAEGHAQVVRALIEAGADINAALDSGFTPFLRCARGAHRGRPRAPREGNRRQGAHSAA